MKGFKIIYFKGFYIDTNSLFNDISTNNTINDMNTQYYFGLNGTSLSPIIIENNFVDIPYMTNLGQIILINCENITIQNCTIKNGSKGIYIYRSNNLTIINNTINLRGVS